MIAQDSPSLSVMVKLATCQIINNNLQPEDNSLRFAIYFCDSKVTIYSVTWEKNYKLEANNNFTAHSNLMNQHG